jgi:uncharacterized protein
MYSGAGSKTLNCTHDFSQCAPPRSDSFGFSLRGLCMACRSGRAFKPSVRTHMGGGRLADAWGPAVLEFARRAGAFWLRARVVGDRLVGGCNLRSGESDFPATSNALDPVRLGFRSSHVGLGLPRKHHVALCLRLAACALGVWCRVLRLIWDGRGPCLVHDPHGEPNSVGGRPAQWSTLVDTRTTHFQICYRWICAAQRDTTDRCTVWRCGVRPCAGVALEPQDDILSAVMADFRSVTDRACTLWLAWKTGGTRAVHGVCLSSAGLRWIALCDGNHLGARCVKYLLAFLVVLLVAWRWRTERAARQLDTQRNPRPTDKPVDMVCCGQCGVHTPVGSAVTGKRGLYCSLAHRQEAEP